MNYSTISQLTAASSLTTADYLEIEQGGTSKRVTVADFVTLLAASSSMLDAFVPVGFIYVQLPTMTAPATLWPGGTWSDVSTTFAGAFFRAAGGNASTFESGVQADALQGHYHTSPIVKSNSDTTTPSITTYRTATNVGGTTAQVVQAPSDDGSSGTVRTAIETRPTNYTVKVWKRTA